LGRWKKRVLQIGIAIALIIGGFAVASAILAQSIWLCLICVAVTFFLLYFLYVELHQKKKIGYPMVPPEGKTDIYFPRTNIPRPIHEDFRKMQEKKKKLDRIRKTRRKKS